MLILASQSTIRAKILRDAGVVFETSPALVDETAIKYAMIAEAAKPRDVADVLGEAKARKVSQKFSGVLVLGSDQVLALDGTIFSKAKTKEQMIEQLRDLRGRRHNLYASAVIVLDGEPIWRFIGEAVIMMREFSDEFLNTYVEKNFDQIRHSVGGYQIEGPGAQLIEDYRGDYFSVLGLPLFAILAYLRERGELDT